MSLLPKYAGSGLLLALALLGGCSLFAPVPPPAPALPALPSYDLVGAIRAAGDRETTSVISVNALREPGIAGLQDAAQQDERAGRYADAAAKLDQALKLSPDSPDLLQERAEVAVRLKDYPDAEKFARQSWSVGPKLGPLCARNWQTIVEMRLQARDELAAESARKWVQQCHKPGVPRF